MNFEEEYGRIGHGYIHVHHLSLISELEGAGENEVDVDPEKDLRPICPNCHAMVHQRKEFPFTIDELKEIRRKAKDI